MRVGTYKSHLDLRCRQCKQALDTRFAEESERDLRLDPKVSAS
jgi:tRNA(Ile2) C34 agmatinyltransferase TiaS